ncbi:MAG: hypothetical protein C5B46_04050 [Proteobacteria bacterium]|nr:MAG: hypothetical protein C5B46_04050 [Pseudomonadota bacterium]
MRVFCAAVFAGFAIVLSSMAFAAEAPATAGSDEEALARLRAQITELIGQPTCSNLVHCRVLALGTKPCGGPAEYLAYSSITSNRELLEAKAYEYSFLDQEVNAKRGVVGTCEVLREPHVLCIDRRCRLAPQGQ